MVLCLGKGSNGTDHCKERGVGVLWATHLVDEAQPADSVVVLHRGQVIACDSPQAVVEAQGTQNLAEAFFKLTSGEDSDGKDK